MGRVRGSRVTGDEMGAFVGKRDSELDLWRPTGMSTFNQTSSSEWLARGICTQDRGQAGGTNLRTRTYGQSQGKPWEGQGKGWGDRTPSTALGTRTARGQRRLE